MIRKKILMAAIPLFVISGADAAVSLDRTRAVFDGSEKSMTLDISNDNKQLPYLAQAWIENENQEKIITGPVIATPPVQRLEPGAKSMVRLSTTPDISKLPQENPTPYYVTVIGLGGSEKQAEEGEFETVMLSPRSEQTVKSANYNTPYLSYINDYGGRPVLSFICNGSRCSVKKEK